MPQGDKSAYTDKQKRKAAHIADGYEERGVPEKEAEARAWAAVNKDSGGGNLSGSGRGKPDTHASSHEGGKQAAGGFWIRRHDVSCGGSLQGVASKRNGGEDLSPPTSMRFEQALLRDPMSFGFRVAMLAV